jgi:hypothetical protein
VHPPWLDEQLKEIAKGRARRIPALEEKAEQFDAGDPEYQIIDIAEAREDGIMPISFEAGSP